MVLPICWMMTGARPSVGSSSSSSRAPVRRMRPIASICCSPPDSLVPWLEPAAPSGWETVRRCGRATARPAAPPAAAADSPRRRGSRRCRAPPDRRRCRRARSRSTAGRSASRPSKRTEPVRLRDDAHDRFQRRGLAGAVAAEQRHHLARLHVESDAVQDVRLAVPGLQVLDREQRRARTSSMAGPHIGFAHLRIVRDRLRSRLRPGRARASAP